MDGWGEKPNDKMCVLWGLERNSWATRDHKVTCQKSLTIVVAFVAGQKGAVTLRLVVWIDDDVGH
jgi:hypothetical protein